MSQDRRKVRRLCYEEVYLDECSIGNIIETLPRNTESSPNITPTSLSLITSDIEALNKRGKLDTIEAVRVTLHNVDPKCVKIEESRAK